MNDTHQDQQMTAFYQPGVAVEDLQLILDRTPVSVWHALRGQRIFITGGTGFIGCWLLEALIWANRELDLGVRLTVLTRRPDAFREKAPHLANDAIVQLLEGDVNDLGAYSEPVDVVLHAATDVANAVADQRIVFDDIVNGTRQTLALATRCGAVRYLLTSSGAVYGRQPSDMTHVSEQYQGAPDTLQPNTAYGQGKRVSEWLVQNQASQQGLKTGIARVFALLGPYLPLNAQFAAGNFILDGLNQRDIKVGGDGTAQRSYLYAADMVVWLLTILIDGAPDQAYNLGSDHAMSIRELAEAVSDLMYGCDRVTIGATAQPNSPVMRYVPSVDKARTQLNLLQYTDLRSAIRKTIDWRCHSSQVADREQSGNS